MEESVSASSSRGQRTLAAVVFTDGVNFSARMSQNEERTLDLISRDLTLMRELCQNYDGRVLKSTGDGLLMCFSSAINAVTCALAIQKELTETAALLPAEEALQHRIGIHLGDVYISATDVMGTGVNIAARLQGQANPGGICISQTVYDVVRTSVNNATLTYLGLRKLKNIQEEIPVYQVELQAPEEGWTEVKGEPAAEQSLPRTVTQFTPLEPHEVVARNLSEHEHGLRIRKLMLCVCRNTWENNPDKLNQLNLGGLVKELLGIAPTAMTLQQVLYRVIQSLSKRAEYELVARIIMDEFGGLYAARSSQTLSPLEEAAQKLQQSPHVERIKKLILCVCQDVWENDSAKLGQLRLVDQLAELLEVAPTTDLLITKLRSVIRTLNKQSAYAALANAILQAMQPLYGLVVSQVPTAATLPIQTNAPIQPTVTDAPSSNVQPPPPASRVPGIVPPPPPPLVPKAEVQQEAVSATPPISNSQVTLNWFDIRADLMRYTNPLRAKLLIFSALHGEIGCSEMNLLSLRMHPLDALLQSLIQGCPTPKDMEKMLHDAAQRLDEQELCFQAAGSILQAFRPIYSSPSLLELARKTTVTTDEQTIVRPDLNPLNSGPPTVPNADASCQFFIRS